MSQQDAIDNEAGPIGSEGMEGGMVGAASTQEFDDMEG